MKRISTVIFIFTLSAWTVCGLLNAAPTFNVSSIGKSELQQHPRHKRPPHPSPVMNDTDFKFLYDVIKGKTFDQDRLELLSVGVLDNYFSCRQCVRLMSLYTFDDDKLKMLNIMAGHIVDLENASLILDSLTFDSNKKKAAALLHIHRK